MQGAVPWTCSNLNKYLGTMEKNKRHVIDSPVNPFFICIALPIALFVTVLSYICVLFGCTMKKTIKGVNKVINFLQ